MGCPSLSNTTSRGGRPTGSLSVIDPSPRTDFDWPRSVLESVAGGPSAQGFPSVPTGLSAASAAHKPVARGRSGLPSVDPVALVPAARIAALETRTQQREEQPHHPVTTVLSSNRQTHQQGAVQHPSRQQTEPCTAPASLLSSPSQQSSTTRTAFEAQEDKPVPSSQWPTSWRTRLRCSSEPREFGWSTCVQFFDSWAASIPKLFGTLSSHSVLLKSPKAPSLCLAAAVREQHLSSTITASYQTPFFLAEIPFAVQEQ